MRQKLLSTAICMVALLLTLFVRWTAPAGAQVVTSARHGGHAAITGQTMAAFDDDDCDDDDECDDDDDDEDCESYLVPGDDDDNQDSDDDDCEGQEQDGFLGSTGPSSLDKSIPGLQNGSFGDWTGGSPELENAIGSRAWILDLLRNFNLISNHREGLSGLAPVGAVLAGMALVYGTLLRILRRRLARE